MFVDRRRRFDASSAHARARSSAALERAMSCPMPYPERCVRARARRGACVARRADEFECGSNSNRSESKRRDATRRRGANEATDANVDANVDA